MTLTDVRSTPAGELVEVSGCCYANGNAPVEGITGLLVRSGGPRRREKRPADTLPAERFRKKIPTRDGQQIDYARVSGDRNFIHTSALLARAAGLPRTILHGACVLAMVCRALTDALTGGDSGRIEEIGCRFARPALPGTPLTLVGYESTDRRRTPFQVLDESNRPILKNGTFHHR
jgi:acyl dehydratase